MADPFFVQEYGSYPRKDTAEHPSKFPDAYAGTSDQTPGNYPRMGQLLLHCKGQNSNDRTGRVSPETAEGLTMETMEDNRKPDPQLNETGYETMACLPACQHP